jgi:hypothetical protein
MLGEWVVWWMEQRKFKSSCRVCGAWRVQGYHWIPMDTNGPTGEHSNSAHKEECSPSDNLEYLEWCLEKKLESR